MELFDCCFHDATPSLFLLCSCLVLPAIDGSLFRRLTDSLPVRSFISATATGFLSPLLPTCVAVDVVEGDVVAEACSRGSGTQPAATWIDVDVANEPQRPLPPQRDDTDSYYTMAPPTTVPTSEQDEEEELVDHSWGRIWETSWQSSSWRLPSSVEASVEAEAAVEEMWNQCKCRYCLPLLFLVVSYCLIVASLLLCGRSVMGGLCFSFCLAMGWRSW